MPVAPPPPPPPGPPPPPAGLPAAASDPKGRDLLLKSIRAGTNLKKTVTKDRSAPIIQGKTTNNSTNYNNNNTNGPTNTSRPTIQSGSATIARTNGLGALFADGIPKLKPTRTNIGNQSQSSSLTSLPTANVSSLHGNNNHVIKSVEIGRKALGTKNRGPPPQPPPLTQKPVFPTSISESTLTPAGNTIGNHTRSQSTVSLQNGRIKPSLMPKPQAPAPPPPNKRGGGVSRAHSMRAPASPPILPQMQGVPVFPPGAGLRGTPMFHASTDSLVRGAMRPKPPLKAPTSRPPPPPRTAVPPPPPPIQPPPPPPPLPPHRAAPPLPSTVPPPLPTRHSSMRNGYTPGEFESRFIFRSVKDFPAPPPFRNLNKIYNSKTVKAPAPAPPATPQFQLNSKLYSSRDTSNC